MQDKKIFNLIYRSVCAGYDFAKFEALNGVMTTNLEKLTNDIMDSYTKEEKNKMYEFIDLASEEVDSEETEKEKTNHNENTPEPDLSDTEYEFDQDESDFDEIDDLPSDEDLKEVAENTEVTDKEVQSPFENVGEDDDYDTVEAKKGPTEDEPESAIDIEELNKAVLSYQKELEETGIKDYVRKEEAEAKKEKDDSFYTLNKGFDILPEKKKEEKVEISKPTATEDKAHVSAQKYAELERKFAEYKAAHPSKAPVMAPAEEAPVKPVAKPVQPTVVPQNKPILTPFGVRNNTAEEVFKPADNAVKPAENKAKIEEVKKPEPVAQVVTKPETPTFVEEVPITERDTSLELEGTISKLVDSMRNDKNIVKYSNEYAIMPTDAIFLSTKQVDKHIAVVMRFIKKETGELSYKYVIYKLNATRGKIYNVTDSFIAENRVPSLDKVKGTKVDWNELRQKHYEKDMSEIFNAYISDALVPELRDKYMSWLRATISTRPEEMTPVCQYMIRNF